MDRSVSRRTILKAGVGTSAAWAFSATSYAKIVGANDRISIAPDRLRRPRLRTPT